MGGAAKKCVQIGTKRLERIGVKIAWRIRSRHNSGRLRAIAYEVTEFEPQGRPVLLSRAHCCRLVLGAACLCDDARRRVACMSRIDFALLLLVSVFGFALCWQIGRIGYLPLDQSIVFDGAWRVVSGQVPWRDFVTPNGLSPILMQALVFQLFGVSWATWTWGTPLR